MNLPAIADSQAKTTNSSSAILPGAPWLIAHKSMLGVERPYKITLNGQDYILWQNKQGEVFALNNICPHMQAPLSDGWVCPERNTITCPFHALEFDGQGRLYREGKLESKAIAQPLELIADRELIWTYGGFAPRLPIPDLIPRITKGFKFMGVAGEKSIAADFLKCLKINYDFNHACGTHREPFKFSAIAVGNYQENGYYTKLSQTITREDNTLADILKQPALLTTPKTLNNEFEYSFPSTTSIVTTSFSGQIAQLFVLYPQKENQTKTFILLYAKPKHQWFGKLIFSLFRNDFLKAFDLVIEQDTTTLENLYPSQKPKIRLPREEIMFYAEQLYRQWGDDVSRERG